MKEPKVLYCYPQMAGDPFMPSNGTEGMVFTCEFCDKCLHEKYSHTLKDGDKKCNILTTSLIGEKPPTEWIFNDEGWPVCTSWQKWDWGNDDDDDGLNEPPEPDPIDPSQLMMPFDIWDLLGVTDEILVTKNAIIERELVEG